MAVTKCTTCGKGYQRMDVHMRTHQVDPNSPKSNALIPQPIQFITKNEFDEYKNESNQKLDTILGFLQGKTEQNVGVSGAPAAAPVAETSIPRTHEEAFSKYFDREDGFDAELDIIENNFYIIVPPKFSNATPAHADYYPVDKRMVHLDSHNPLGTIEEYCQRICRNLKYDKNIKTK